MPTIAIGSPLGDPSQASATDGAARCPDSMEEPLSVMGHSFL